MNLLAFIHRRQWIDLNWRNRGTGTWGAMVRVHFVMAVEVPMPRSHNMYLKALFYLNSRCLQLEFFNFVHLS
jgi:hypothetical protein